MSFGGLNPFGSSSSSSPSSPSQPNAVTASESAQVKNRIINAVQTSGNVANAKYLISKINENCFATCIPSPSASLSSKEQTCLSSCMEKYIEAWNTTSRTYISRLQKEGAAQMGGAAGNPLGGGGGGGGGGGKELF